MQHEINARDGTLGDVDVRQVAFDELDLAQVGQVLPLPGDQAVDHANTLAATHELFGKVRPDEPGAPRHKVKSHKSVTPQQKPCRDERREEPLKKRSAFAV
jgi:hypothetical protein